MKVCLVWRRFGPYHCARLRATAQLLRANGADVVGVQVASQGGVHHWPDEDMGDVEFLTLFPSRDVDSLSRRQIFQSMRALLDRVAPDAVAVPAYSTPEAQASLVWARTRHRIAVVMAESRREDAKRSPIREGVKRAIVSQFDGALAGGTPQRRYIAELGIPSDRIFSPYDVVDNEYFARGAVAARSDASAAAGLPGLESDRPFFLASGRFIKRKNFDNLIRGFAEYRILADGEETWRLIILGDGPDRPHLEALADALDPTGGVIFAGYHQARGLAAYYGMAGAFIHAATIEQWGLVINEAMAAGLPILASTGVGATEDLVTDGVNGFVFDPKDVTAITLAMQRMTAPETNRSAMGEESVKRIARWSPDRFAQALWQAVSLDGKSAARGMPHTVRALLWLNQLVPARILAWRSVER